MTDNKYKSVFESIEDLENQVGKEVGLSAWQTIDQDCISQFAALTKDEQWIHTDEARCAKESPFKKTIAHGFLVLSFGPAFAYDCFEIKGVKMGMSYGFDKIRFINVVPVGAKVRGRFKLLEVTRKEAERRTKMKMEVSFEIAGAEKPAIVAEWITVFFV